MRLWGVKLTLSWQRWKELLLLPKRRSPRRNRSRHQSRNHASVPAHAAVSFRLMIKPPQT